MGLEEGREFPPAWLQLSFPEAMASSHLGEQAGLGLWGARDTATHTETQDLAPVFWALSPEAASHTQVGSVWSPNSGRAQGSVQRSVEIATEVGLTEREGFEGAQKRGSDPRKGWKVLVPMSRDTQHVSCMEEWDGRGVWETCC